MGIVGFELAFGYERRINGGKYANYREKETKEMLRKAICSGDIIREQFPLDELAKRKISSDIISILLKMTKLSATDRPTAVDLLKQIKKDDL